jgi:hypothetical protein
MRGSTYVNQLIEERIELAIFVKDDFLILQKTKRASKTSNLIAPEPFNFVNMKVTEAPFVQKNSPEIRSKACLICHGFDNERHGGIRRLILTVVLS